MGIEVSRLNARLLIAALGDEAYPGVPEDLEQVGKAAAGGKIVVTGGLHPGQSTNATAALIAEKVKAKMFLNATDVDGIYDSDPNKNKSAKMFKEITVKKCLELLGSENSAAGAYDLMDIVALKVIERSKIRTAVIKSDPAIIKGAIAGKATGTRIVV
jgi:uridylate kinase